MFWIPSTSVQLMWSPFQRYNIFWKINYSILIWMFSIFSLAIGTGIRLIEKRLKQREKQYSWKCDTRKKASEIKRKLKSSTQLNVKCNMNSWHGAVLISFIQSISGNAKTWWAKKAWYIAINCQHPSHYTECCSYTAKSS